MKTTLSLPVEVTYNYTPACRGSRERGTGLPLEPDEPDTVDVESIEIPAALILHKDGRFFVRESALPKDTQRELIDDCFLDRDNNARDAAESRAAERYEDSLP